jgi:hypothetical protein
VTMGEKLLQQKLAARRPRSAPATQLFLP